LFFPSIIVRILLVGALDGLFLLPLNIAVAHDFLLLEIVGG
jgi:hypothetical protein